MSINNVTEVISIPATQQAYVDLVGLILKENQEYHANSNVDYYWLGNAMTNISKILLSDAIKVVGIDSLESTANWSNSLLQNNGSAFYDSGIQESFNVMPSNVGANVFVTNSYRVLIQPKDFQFANVFSSNVETTYIEEYSRKTLANSNVYGNLSISTGIDYAFANTYLDNYSYSSNSLLPQQDVTVIENTLELAFGVNKTGIIQLLGGGI